MADQRISDLNAATSIADADLLTIVQSGTNKKITNLVYRTSLGYLQKKVTVSSAQLLTLGTVPVELIAAPGANKYLNIIKTALSYKYNSVAYNFALNNNLLFLVGSLNSYYKLIYSKINQASSFNATLADLTTTFCESNTNTAYTVTAELGTDPTTGNGDLDVVVYYSIEDVNT